MTSEFLSNNFRAPDGFPADNVLTFNIFVVSSSDDNDLRPEVDAVLRKLERRAGFEEKVRLREYHYQQQAVLPSNAHGQAVIDHQNRPERRHIVVGLIGRRLGWISQNEELLPALQATGVRSLVLVFAADEVLEDSREPQALKEALARQEEIDAFAKRVEELSSGHREIRTVHRFGAGPKGLETLRSTLEQQLYDYVELWFKEAKARPSVLPMAMAEAPPSPASGDHETLPRYLGLRPYSKKDAPYFFGRRREIESLCQIAQRPEVQSLQIRGGSGTGKSSLVFAGVLPKLRTPDGVLWDSLWLKPGEDPFLALADAVNNRLPSLDQVEAAALEPFADRLKDPKTFLEHLATSIKKVSSGRRVLYIDQLEELLMVPDGETYEKSLACRQLFIERLTSFLAADRSNLLISSIRTDRDELLGGPEWQALHHLLNEGVQRRVVAPDPGEGLQEIVEGPAKLAGFSVEGALLDALRDDTQDIPSWPPLVSAALEDMVRRWRDRAQSTGRRELTLDLYEAGGGLWEIIARRVKSAMSSLNVRQRETTLLELFPFLVTLDERGRPTKKRISVHRFAPGTEERELLDQLIKSNLLLDEGEVELVHDILFEEWKELRDWMQNHRSSDLDEMAALEREANRWRLRPWDEGLLLSSERLDPAEKALAGNSIWAERAPGVRPYVKQSRLYRERKDLIAALKTGDLVSLVTLRRNEALRLTPAELKSLGDFSAFYYAAFPEAIPPKAEADAASGLAGDFKSGSEAVSSEKVPDLEGVIPAGSTRVRASSNVGPHHFAALGGSIAILERLQTLGLDIFAKTANGGSVFNWAAASGKTEVVRWLVAQVARESSESEALARLGEPNNSGYGPVHSALYQGDPAMLRYLLASIVDPELDRATSDGWSLVSAACYWGRLEALQVLLADPRFSLSTAAHPQKTAPLSVSLARRHWVMARWLVDEQAGELDVNRLDDLGWPALGLALSHVADQDSGVEAMEVTRRLLDLGPDLDLRIGKAEQVPLLTFAVRTGSLELVERFLGRCDINARDAKGRTALHDAAILKDTAILRKLLAQGDLQLYPEDETGVTPLALAVQEKNEEAFQCFLDAGSVPRWTDARGRPLLGGLFTAQETAGRPAASSSQRERLQRHRERLRLGRMAEALLARGARLPRWKTPLRDKARRLVGFELPAWTEATAQELQAELASAPAELRWPSPAVAGFVWTEHPHQDAARWIIDLVRGDGLIRSLLEALPLYGVRSAPMPHYRGMELIEIAVRDWVEQPAVLVALRAADGSCVHLDGSSGPMHQLNRKIQLQLADEGEAEAYLRMFMACLAASSATFSTFRVIDDVGELVLTPGSDPDEMLAQIREKVLPLRFTGRTEPSESSSPPGFLFDASLLYANAIFEARMCVYADGTVDMQEDTPIANEIGALVDVFEHGLKYSRVVQPEKEEPAEEDGDA